MSACPAGKYAASDGTCMDCDSLCAECSAGGATSCTSCLAGGSFDGVEGTCTYTCPLGQYVQSDGQTCADCDAMDNILWYRCLGCGAHCPSAAVALAKEDARRVLSQAQTLGVAEKDNPFRAGVLGGYALGRYKAVAEDGGAQHPAAFADVALMPPPPPRDKCSLPDSRLLGITFTVSEGAAEWPEGV